MSIRRKARENTLQILYRLGVNQGDLPVVFEEFWKANPCHRDIREFTEKLVSGTWERREEIDREISGNLTDWNLERLSQVDRNILRAAAYEILFCPDIPSKVSINEALEIARRFSSPESVGFINGVLNNIMHLEKGE
ncbi:MAG: transcription antitermination factor NusB [bacterium]